MIVEYNISAKNFGTEQGKAKEGNEEEVIIEKIMKKLEKKLLYMPIGIRYICKIIETNVIKYKLAENKEEIIRKEIMDFLFNIWWAKDILNGSRYGISKDYLCDDPILLRKILIIFKSILYNNNINDNTEYGIRINKYINSKQIFIQKFIKYLLDINLPDYNISGNYLYTSCISLQSLENILPFLYKNIEDVFKINEDIGKSIEFIKETIDLNPIGNYFKSGTMEKLNMQHEKVGFQDQKEPHDYYYILFHDFSQEIFKKKTHSIFSEVWQDSFTKLLSDIDISAFRPIDKNSQETELINVFLDQLYKDPLSFQANKENEMKIKLLALCLKKERISLEKLIDIYTKEIKLLIENKLELDKLYPIIVKGLQLRNNIIKENGIRNLKQIYIGLLTEILFNELCLDYEIKKEVKKSSK